MFVILWHSNGFDAAYFKFYWQILSRPPGLVAAIVGLADVVLSPYVSKRAHKLKKILN